MEQQKQEVKKKKRGHQGEGGGRPPKIPNEEVLSSLIENYLKVCDETNTLPNKAGLRYALHLDRTTYNSYKNKYPDTLKRTEDWIEQCWIKRLAGNSPTGAIFYLKNAFKEDYKDRQETDVTSGGEPLIFGWQKHPNT